MDYQRDRNRSYLALIQRLKAPTCTEKDKEFSTLLNETCTLWEDAESDAVVPVSPVADGKNQLPTPVTSPSSSGQDDDEPERVETETDNDSDSDSDSDADADPSEQFLEAIQVQHVVVYHRDTLPAQTEPQPSLSYDRPAQTEPQPPLPYDKPAQTEPQHSLPYDNPPTPPVMPSEDSSSESTAPVEFTNPFATPPLSPDRVVPITSSLPTPSPLSPTSSTFLYSPNPFLPSRSNKRSRKSAYRVESDDEEDEGHASEDEYRPSPSPPPSSYKRRRVSFSPSPFSSPSSSSPSSSKSRSSSTKHSSTRTPAPRRRRRDPNSPPSQALSRNVQSSNPWVDRLSSGDQSALKWLESCDFTCPECSWIQTSRRMPDFQRHVLTHRRPDQRDADSGWWCKGVPVEQRELYGNGIPKDAKAYEFRGKWRIGGCLKTFSRRDALGRHLDNVNVRCVGKACRADQE